MGGLLLLGEPDFAHAALTDDFEQPVRADHGAGSAAGGDGLIVFHGGKRRTFQERIGLLIEQGLHFGAELGIVWAGLGQKRRALFGRLGQGGLAEGLDLAPQFSLRARQSASPAIT